jgi:hypothetical protein
MKDPAQPGSLLVGLRADHGQETWARDGVLALGASYPEVLDLSPEAVRRAVRSPSAQIAARNLYEHARGRPAADRHARVLRDPA